MQTIPKIAHRILSNLTWSILSEIIGKGGFFVANIYLARTLGVENFGLFSLAQTITLNLWIAVDLGTSMYGIREIAKNKADAENVINPLLTIRIISGLFVFLVYTLILIFFLNMPFYQVSIFFGCGLYLLFFNFYIDWVFKGLEKFQFIIFGSVLSSIVFLAGVFLLVKKSEDAAVASFVWSCSYIAGGIPMFVVLGKILNLRFTVLFNTEIWKFHLRESIQFTFAGIFSIFYNYLPIILLGVFSSKHDIGLFSAPTELLPFLVRLVL
jgi:O-antigen/teichoic acid export membrane protein